MASSSVTGRGDWDPSKVDEELGGLDLMSVSKGAMDATKAKNESEAELARLKSLTQSGAHLSDLEAEDIQACTSYYLLLCTLGLPG